MSTFEESFNTSVLDVIVPISSVGFPSQDPPANPAETSEWVETLQDEAVDRKTAFFGKVHYITFTFQTRLFLAQWRHSVGVCASLIITD